MAEELGNVSKACKIIWLSRDTFYRYKDAVEDGSIQTLFDQNRRKTNLKNRVDKNIETAAAFAAFGYAIILVILNNS